MARKTLILSMLIVFLLLSAFPAQADNGYALQTGELSISAWHLHYSQHAFSVSDPGFATLTVTKLTPDQDIRRGFLYLNHRAIPLKSFFRSSDLVFERKVKLRANNRLNVFLWGEPGASIQVDIRLNDVPAPPPAIAFEADPSTIISGGISTLVWQVENADSVTIDNGIGAVAAASAVQVTPEATTTYTLTATGSGGTATAQVTVSVNPQPPTVTLTVEPQTIVAGESTVLTWSSEHAQSCVLEPDIGVVDLNGSMTVTPGQTTVYRIIATGDGGEASAEVIVTVVDPVPTVEISAAAATILVGESTTLTWAATHAASCAIEPGIGAVDPVGSVTVSPTETTTYIITATGAGGSAAAQVTVAVEYPVPAVTFSASPSSIEAGQTAQLSWECTYADTVRIDQAIGTVAVSGVLDISPGQTTTYTLTATGPGGETTQTVTVTVTQPVPLVTITADPTAITIGESATLTWNAAHADTVTIDQGIGAVSAAGSTTVSPAQTTTYSITAVGPGGTATASVTVTVDIPMPQVTLSASPQAILVGQTATLSWTSAYAQSVVIDPGIGSVDSNGNVTVSPTHTTTYTLSATNATGVTTAEVVVTVNYPHVPPSGEFSASPSSIVLGGSAQLSWSSTNANSASIDNGIGSVALNGSVTVSPETTTIYSLTLTGDSDVVSYTVQVTVTTADSDADGLPDWWELKYAETLDSFDGSVDSDGDGLTDAIEFKYGLNPGIADSLTQVGKEITINKIGRITVMKEK